MCVCARARCKYESNFSVFFLPPSPAAAARRPRGSGRPAGRRLGGPARAGAGVGGAGSGSLFHIPGVWAGEKTGERGLGVWGAGSGRASPPRRGHLSRKPGGRGEGAVRRAGSPPRSSGGAGEGRPPSRPLCASRFSRETAPEPPEKAGSRPQPRV